ncbi:MAG TPA: hypothetical protein VNO30_40035 [Kofleriaceae bacterium]|nr:hypothetical protein [Kofleriaceae bacterium]
MSSSKQDPVALPQDPTPIKAHVKLLNAAAARPVLEIAVPRGTTIKDSLRVIGQLDGLIERLTGCPCISGLDIQFRDRVILESRINIKKKTDVDFEQEIDLHG